MTRRLIAYVHVDGTAYGPNDKIPEVVAKRIGDHAWTDTDQDDGGQQQQSSTSGEAPPRSGRGSGIDAWRAFAEQHDLDVDADATREQIIADLEERGVIEREE